MLTSPFSRLSAYYPWSLIAVLILAIVAAAVGVFIYIRATKDASDSIEKKLEPFLKKTTAFLARFGLMPSNPLNQSFDTALSMMRNFIGGTQYRYRLPWIVLMGSTAAGKSTLLEGLELDRPIDRPHHDPLENKPLCDWWFYDHGIVLDLNGHMVIDETKPQSDESNWGLFLNLLAHHRPKRALDGIVLTIPVSELTGATALSHDDLMLRANYLYDKLWQMQRMTSLRVPVYVVITKCDLLPGFESVCKALPTWAKSNMFGWSNDKALDATYSEGWVDEAFASTNLALSRVQEEVYADDDTSEQRDGVFLFPLAFNQIRDGVRTYINNLFKPSSYHESFFLRGIYFVGDSHIEKVQTHATSTLEFPWHFTEKQTFVHRNLYFVRDIFEQKIFREMGLARPVSRILLGNTTLIRFAKGVLAILAVLGTLGLLRANDYLQNARLNLMSILPQIDITLEQVEGRNEKSEVGRLYFDQQAQGILDAMTQINVTSITSPFVPPSWLSHLNAKIRHVMVLVYDKVILRSMGRQLHHKAKQIMSLATLPPLLAEENPEIDPLKTREFKRLQTYVKELHALQVAATTYNGLGANSSLQDVASIIKFLFNYTMPEAFFENDEYYLSALAEADIPAFNFSEYQPGATEKLNKLFQEFQHATFEPTYIIPGLGLLTKALYQFSGARNYTAHDADLLRDVYLGLDQTINSIENPAFQWIQATKFYPGLSYEHVLQLITESPFFQQDTAPTLTAMMNQDFMNFRKRLAEYASPLFDKEPLFVSENGLALAAPSEGARMLATNLRAFFGEIFMAPPQGKEIVVAVPVGAVLLWDTLRLQEAVDIIGSYNKFIDTRLLNLPKSLQPLLQKIASESLTKNLVDYIANAEIFSAPSVLINSTSSPEDAILPSVQNYSVAAPYLNQILTTLRENNAQDAFTALKTLITVQCYAPLVKLDDILTDEAPYAFKDQSFNWWTGEQGAALQAFSVPNITELRTYLSLQRNRITYLAQEFAKPLVTFLAKVNEEGMPGNMPLVDRWQGILTALSEYTRKAPGCSLTALENYITGPLNEVTLKTCSKYTHTADMLSGTHDFFLDILVDIEDKLQARCEGIVVDSAVTAYQDASSFFNTHLAGRFPFVNGKDLKAPDADPEDVRTFFQMMEGKLEDAKTAPGMDCNALRFIQQMEAVKAFLGGFLACSDALPVPTFVFEVKFRVNREAERHGNEVLDWNIISHDLAVSMRSQSPKGYWVAGDPINVVFKWAANSPLQPMASKGIPDLEVQDSNAIFSYSGMWALLRLYMQHQDASCGLKSSGKASAGALGFEVPLKYVSAPPKGACAPKAKVFLSLSFAPLSKPLKPDSIPSGDTAECATGEELRLKMQQKLPLDKVVEVPVFPYHAPEMKCVRFGHDK